MDRVFLDANVLFSAAYREAARLQKLWEVPNARLITSAYAIDEADRNLKTDEQRIRLRTLLASVEVVAELPANWDVGHGLGLSLKDVPILQGAVQGQATHLLTGDRDFGRLFGTTYEGVLIQRPADYLRSEPKPAPPPPPPAE